MGVLLSAFLGGLMGTTAGAGTAAATAGTLASAVGTAGAVVGAAAAVGGAATGIMSATGATGGGKGGSGDSLGMPGVVNPAVAAEETRKEEMRRRAKVTQTLLTSPQGAFGTAETGKKVLLGG